MMEPRAK